MTGTAIPVGRSQVAARRGNNALVTAKTAALLGWTAALLIVLAGGVVTWPAARFFAWWRRCVIRLWGRGVARILGVRLAIQGRPPTPPFLLVSNHLSYLDIVLFAATTGCVFVSRHDVRGWPVIGTVARLVGTVFIDRARKRDALRAADDMRRYLDRRHGVVVFAEGTSSAGARVQPMRTAMLEVAARDLTPVHYAAVTYRAPAGAPPTHELACWWGDMRFGSHFRELTRWTSIEASIVFGDEAIQHHDRKSLAAELHRAISERFVPTVTEDIRVAETH